MTIKVSSKRQVTFPARVLDALGAKPGDQLELVECELGFLLKVRRIDRSKLGTLSPFINQNQDPFDVNKFREGSYESSLRD